ncbi:MAG: glycosyltransferase family 61 protein [Verrucomicrobiales bacterium]
MKIHPAKRWRLRLSRLAPPSKRFQYFGFASRILSLAEAPDLVIGELNGYKVAKIPNGTATFLGLHLDRDYSLYQEISRAHNEKQMKDYWIKRSCWFPKVTSLPGCVLSLATEAQSNFYHWLYESLPKAGVVEPFKPLSEFNFVYCSLKNPFHRDSLEWLGISLDRVISSEEHPYIKAELLYVAEDIRWPGVHQLGFLRNRLFPNLNIKNGSLLSPRIYVSRSKCQSRKVLNEPEVLAFLERHGFKRVFLEDLPFAEQATIFRGAKLIVAPHGAGLANVAFCDPGLTLIELFPAHLKHPLYNHLVTLLPGRHIRLEGEEADAESNFHVPLGALKEAMHEAVGSTLSWCD